MTDPTTPSEVLERRKNKGWKPDPQGRLLFRPGHLFGSSYVVETGQQLDRIEKFRRNISIGSVLVGAAALPMVLFQSDADELALIGMLVVFLILLAGLLAYLFIAGARIATSTAMRPRP